MAAKQIRKSEQKKNERKIVKQGARSSRNGTERNTRKEQGEKKQRGKILPECPPPSSSSPSPSPSSSSSSVSWHSSTSSSSIPINQMPQCQLPLKKRSYPQKDELAVSEDPADPCTHVPNIAEEEPATKRIKVEEGEKREKEGEIVEIKRKEEEVKKETNEIQEKEENEDEEEEEDEEAKKERLEQRERDIALKRERSIRRSLTEEPFPPLKFPKLTPEEKQKNEERKRKREREDEK